MFVKFIAVGVDLSNVNGVGGHWDPWFGIQRADMYYKDISFRYFFRDGVGPDVVLVGRREED